MASEWRTPSARDARARAAHRVLKDSPWIAILLLTSGFQFFRRAPADGVVFLLAGIALTADALGMLGSVTRHRKPRRVIAFSIGAVLVVLLTIMPRYSVADGLIVVGVGLTMIPFAWPETPSRPVANADTGADPAGPPGPPLARIPSAVRRAAVLWSFLAVALCLWEMISFFLGMPSAAAEYTHPALSDLIDPIVANPIGRLVCVAAWLLGGAALLRRSDHP